MKEFVVFVVVALGVANAASVPSQCVVGHWSDWSECTPSRRCVSSTEREAQTKTFQMEASDAWDSGRDAMRYAMKMKETGRAERAACAEVGNCQPSMADRPSSGPMACGDGLAGDLPCSNVDLLSFINFVDMGYVKIPSDTTPEGNDVWGWTDPLNNDEYAIMGLTAATTFVRITDPYNPVPVGVLYTETVASIWRDIKVIGNYAYIVSEARNHGLQVFDLTRLRGKTSPETFLPDATHKGFGSAHNVVANEETNFVYVVGATQGGFQQTCRGGLYVLDVSNPLNPVYRGCFGADGYVHDAQCVIYRGPDVRWTGSELHAVGPEFLKARLPNFELILGFWYQGNEICFCFNENSFTIVDVTNKASMTMIGKTGYAGVAYTHQGWITEDHEVALMDDEMDENGKPADQQFTKTYVWDIRDLRLPLLKTVYQAEVRSIDHNQYIIGDLTFQANYESGLRILHLDRASYELSQVAYFDVLPSRTTADWYGSWSVYPYFNSGNVVVSSIDYGLFIVRPDYAAINRQVESKTISAERTRTREVVRHYGRAVCPALEQYEKCDAEISC